MYCAVFAFFPLLFTYVNFGRVKRRRRAAQYVGVDELAAAGSPVRKRGGEREIEGERKGEIDRERRCSCVYCRRSNCVCFLTLHRRRGYTRGRIGGVYVRLDRKFRYLDPG